MEISSSSTQVPDQPAQNSTPTTKKKRSLPGTPDPDSPVVALSPITLLSTNRFYCYICNKGFKRPQNLQLHHRGHNPLENLRRSDNTEVKKCVYVCPVPDCIYHHPSRALTDFTAIKNHYFRKHGEKKHECSCCLKKYAIQSDCKAHQKICGIGHHCACGRVFKRSDSLNTHRALCHPLSEIPSSVWEFGAPTTIASPAELSEYQTTHLPPPSLVTGTPSSLTTFFANLFNQYSSCTELPRSSSHNDSLTCSMDGPDHPGAIDPISLSLSSSQYGSASSSIFQSLSQNNSQTHFIPSPLQALSATALLQMGDNMSSDTSLLHGLWFPAAPSLDLCQDNVSTMASSATTLRGLKLEKNSIAPGLELELLSNGFNNELMMDSSDLFSDKPATLDLLGLVGMGGDVAAPSSGFSELCLR